jgi:hypothetical protein
MINSTILEVLNLKWNVKAAVKGYYLNGMKFHEISLITGLNWSVIEEIIEYSENWKDCYDKRLYL